MKCKEYLNITYKKGEWVQEVNGLFGKKGKGRIVDVYEFKVKVKYLYDEIIYEYNYNEITKG